MNHPILEQALCRCATIIAVLLTGCATTTPSETPKLERLTGSALETRIPAPTAAMPIEAIIAMARRGDSASAIIAGLDTTHSTFRLNAGQIAALMAERVPPPVIDHILDTERRRIFDDLAADVARRDQACAERIEQVQREAQLCRLQSMQPWPGATCWPPYIGVPYWR